MQNKRDWIFCREHNFNKGLNYYQSLWDLWNPNIHKVALEASPGYTRVTHQKLLNSAKNIAEVKAKTRANFKFIYIMRDPILRIESHYTQGRKHQHKDTAKPLSEGIQAEILDTSKYAMQLEEYYNRFPRESILLLNFEFFKQEPLIILKQVCKFLDLDETYQFPQLDINHNKYTSEINRVAIPGYQSLRKTQVAHSLIQEMPDNIKQKLHFVRNLLSRKVKNEYVKLSLEQKRYILNELQEDLNILEQKYQFDTSSWNLNI
ncbi:MAG: sulfotransferase [Hyellaceae cyanobacterium CSU_1_1]|nr:sulfotransferase [Hyellaceae cyanobacterium CSU_1_1]